MLYTIKSDGVTEATMATRARAVVPESTRIDMLRSPVDQAAVKERFDLDMYKSIHAETRAIGVRLCVLIVILFFILAANSIAIFVTGFYVMKYEEVVKIYISNMTSPDIISAPLSAPSVSGMANQIRDMLDAAHTTSQMLTNDTFATEIRRKALASEADVDDVSRELTISAGLSRLNQTLISAENVAGLVSSAHTTNLMDALTAAIRDNLANVDMQAVNDMLAMAGNDTYVQHALRLADTAVAKVENYEGVAKQLGLFVADYYRARLPPNSRALPDRDDAWDRDADRASPPDMHESYRRQRREERVRI
ncbi:hypothetical protein CYMTET_35668 [Cymbomonas tetramitiformis]|uniref:Uncharacterized protein n=1 Tax=Cymbomonas tetramitiformis TaxID=36881 RepID=A0AAE0F8X4_9CHLO|nr:hypothetical protein CYMTET_35668 [Cymbomonas tetramitiformis]|eukprot:gene306-565_t